MSELGEQVSVARHNRINLTEGFPAVRMRRLRQHPKLRDLVREHQLSVQDLVLPLFVKEGSHIQRPIQSMPGNFQLSVDQLDAELSEIIKLGIPAVLLLGIPEHKDAVGSASWHANGVVQQATRRIKQLAPELLVIADSCLCEYTDHGHCGPIGHNAAGDFEVDNDVTLELLVKQAVSLATAGADVIAPSGMMDGAVSVIRTALDASGFMHIPILSYSVKYASAFYGPFRDAAECAPQLGDRNSYQMDPANAKPALREAELDIAEGADMLMVKPALMYLDVIYQVKQRFPQLPLAGYQVSGEFSMIKAAAEKGWLDESKAMMESLISIKRAGADFIISYFAKDAARFLQVV